MDPARRPPRPQTRSPPSAGTRPSPRNYPSRPLHINQSINQQNNHPSPPQKNAPLKLKLNIECNLESTLNRIKSASHSNVYVWNPAAYVLRFCDCHPKARAVTAGERPPVQRRAHEVEALRGVGGAVAARFHDLLLRSVSSSGLTDYRRRNGKETERQTSISPLCGQGPYVLFTGSIQIAGQSQSPVGSFATTSTFPYAIESCSASSAARSAPAGSPRPSNSAKTQGVRRKGETRTALVKTLLVAAHALWLVDVHPVRLNVCPLKIEAVVRRVCRHLEFAVPNQRECGKK